eukprot:TRINITY_DN8402_c0_g1::TRINITY_DN8402_c0_g1_i1::g.29116::m.29116 TRINITY_DN8402_c0_g1::TRINITY_DN8402_c0_g1_i1::g.29116  ORF type:complete len:1121 (+),score=215.28,sp/A1A4J6/ATP9B_BOVIN/52.83/0.0,E1-E2_ATPase/PF00122.15/5.1e-22,Hydrolase/PF00702.21/3.3e+03,Hydrolase/PF00702.21/2.8e-14,HAD/PF12710.2/7.5e-13,Hydrolase_like2/PF13246.1/7.5e-08,Hydrolase_like2/PF13246.1/9.4e+03,Hydrolase_like2/PF13246.1/2.7e+03,Hydrolase_3/PF08282.7/0.0051 TRINITY_DN8402_c0_g1_i1:92-3454(+)
MLSPALKEMRAPLATFDIEHPSSGMRTPDRDSTPLLHNHRGCFRLNLDREHFVDNICTQVNRLLNRNAPKTARTIALTGDVSEENSYFPANVVRNQKYHVVTFIPLVLFNQFRYFWNLYFLIVTLTQFIPALQVGFLFTYVAPLVFVLSVTMMKEAYDDYKRYLRDKEANSERYTRLLPDGSTESIPSSDMQVGHIIQLHSNQRVPADMLLVRTSEKSGGIYIRTDQLDGETDWKLRRAVTLCQKLHADTDLFTCGAHIVADPPKKEIYDFVGNLSLPTDAIPTDVGSKNISSADSDPETQTAAGIDVGGVHTEPLSLENTLWANTVVANGTSLAVVVYTGPDTRAVLNTSTPPSKFGLLDEELNFLSKILCLLMVLMALVIILLKGFQGPWFIYLFRYILLFSSIIPISLRVNLDLAKTLYSVLIMMDKQIPNTVVRTSTIPEELGRVEYIFSDKTGTLTQNDMVFKKLCLGTVTFSKDTLDDVKSYLLNVYSKAAGPSSSASTQAEGLTRRISRAGGFESEATRASQVLDIIRCLAIAHNVTPIHESGPEGTASPSTDTITYQASSPDEVALVRFTECVGLTLWAREQPWMTLRTPLGAMEEYDILNIFPFTSETKRMGIIVRKKDTGEIVFYMKGADVVMSRIVQGTANCEWLDEECGNLAREGLRTLVFAKRILSDAEYAAFSHQYQQARIMLTNRSQAMQDAVHTIEKNLQLLGLTGVEDKLQENVKETLEMLRMSGVRIWMLTGDKIETAMCIARSSRLVSRTQGFIQLIVSTKEEAFRALSELEGRTEPIQDCIVVDGASLSLFTAYMPRRFTQVAVAAPSFICCRCSPTQKAELVTLVKTHTGKRTLAVGDGGNDVSMIQAAHVGVGIVGKEGMQASLAADFSILQFRALSRLLLWHGRNSYKRSARLSQFIIHRGLIISVIQAIFTCIFYFAAVPIYTGWLLVGYTTYYTMMPVFSLVLDEDVSETVAFTYPELYKELQKGRSLSLKTFSLWVFKSLYQGAIIMILAIVLFEDNFLSVCAITFTALLLTEFLMVALEINKWHYMIVLAEALSLLCYFVSILVLRSYFDVTFIFTWTFWLKSITITLASCLPVSLGKYLDRKLRPPAYAKLS